MESAFQNNSILPELKRVLTLEASAILDLANSLHLQRSSWENGILELQSCLKKGGRLVLTGVGKSGKIAQKISATLSSTGSPSLFMHPTEALHGDLGMLGPNDAVIAISNTGNTEEILKIISPIRERQLKLFSMTGNADSKLAKLSDFHFHTPTPEEACPLHLAPTTSTTLSLAVGDAIAVTLMQLNQFQPDHFKANHPGGSLGARLSKTVGEIMHPAHKLTSVRVDTPIEDVIDQLTAQKLGALAVCHESQLLGLITDGDLRRALQKKSTFFQMKARDLMTQNPETCSISTKAMDALKQMENRPSQISVLPVVDQKTGDFLGIVRVHDLLQAF